MLLYLYLFLPFIFLLYFFPYSLKKFLLKPQQIWKNYHIQTKYSFGTHHYKDLFKGDEIKLFQSSSHYLHTCYSFYFLSKNKIVLIEIAEDVNDSGETVSIEIIDVDDLINKNNYQKELYNYSNMYQKSGIFDTANFEQKVYNLINNVDNISWLLPQSSQISLKNCINIVKKELNLS